MNSVNKDKNLYGGKLSKALSKEAGACLQTALHDAKPLNMGDVVSTGGYKLKCREVYHCCLPEYENNLNVRMRMQGVDQ